MANSFVVLLLLFTFKKRIIAPGKKKRETLCINLQKPYQQNPFLRLLKTKNKRRSLDQPLRISFLPQFSQLERRKFQRIRRDSNGIEEKKKTRAHETPLWRGGSLRDFFHSLSLSFCLLHTRLPCTSGEQSSTVRRKQALSVSPSFSLHLLPVARREYAAA